MSKRIILEVYADANGRQPLIEWLGSFKDVDIRARIRNRLSKLEKGHFGDCESVGEGVFELRFFFGPGYRVYFTKMEERIILLWGGDKKTQRRDIIRAKQYCKDVKENGNEAV
jgi:putative addiction module killer protein